MIVLIIGAVVIIFILLAIGITWFSERDKIQQKMEEANMVQNERVKEDLTARYKEVAEPGSLTVTNEWTEDSKITELMSKCNNGEEKTMFFDHEIPAYERNFSTTIRDVRGLLTMRGA